MTRRWLPASLLCLAIGASFLAEALAGLWVGTARAAVTGDPQLLSFDLSATAPGVQFTEDEPSAQTHPEAEAELAQSLAQLRNGPIGYGMSTIAWPGATAGNVGSLLLLVGDPVPGGPPLPEQLTALNDPVRAEARTGSGSSRQRNDSYPGLSMTAAADDSHVSAEAHLQAAGQPNSDTSVGSVDTASSSALAQTGDATATAASRVEHISLAGGAVTIDSVVSTAEARTDGVKATVTGHTLVHGVRIAGQTVTVDQTGVHVGSQGAPANSAADRAVNAAIRKLGMQIALSEPAGKPQGGSVTYNAGSLVFLWTVPNDSSGNVFTATFGGATVSVSASPGGLAGPSVGSPPRATAVLAQRATGPANSVPAGAVSQPTGTTTGAAPQVAPTSGAGSPVLAARSLGLANGVSPWWVALAVAGSVLIALGAGRLPERLLGSAGLPCEVNDG